MLPRSGASQANTTRTSGSTVLRNVPGEIDHSTLADRKRRGLSSAMGAHGVKRLWSPAKRQRHTPEDDTTATRPPILEPANAKVDMACARLQRLIHRQEWPSIRGRQGGDPS